MLRFIYFLSETTTLFGRSRKDYWNWIDVVGDINNNNNER